MEENNKLVSTLCGISAALKALESGIELKSQTSRVNNVLNRGDIDLVLGNTIVALRKLNADLQKMLSE